MEINNAIQLKQAIALLQAQQEEKKFVLVEEFHKTYESLKPLNLIKSTFNKILETPDITNQVVDTSIGLGVGVLSKKLLVGKSTNIFKRFFGTIIELMVANAVAKNSDGIKRQGIQLIKKLIK
jgi:hypothetical protein